MYAGAMKEVLPYPTPGHCTNSTVQLSCMRVCSSEICFQGTYVCVSLHCYVVIGNSTVHASAE